jgi:hypothetical protein
LAFVYNKKGSGDDTQFQWGTYSDLFMNLCIVFLFLYSIANLRSGTDILQKNIEQQQLMKENQDLREQLRVYNTLQRDYVKNGASEDEKETYKQLMDKLSLLKEEAKEEKNELRNQARENEKKEQALNKYQQVIRNIINSNIIASARIQRRDTIIGEKDQQIRKKKSEIYSLEKTLTEKKEAILQNEQKIAAAEQELEKKMRQLKNSYRQNAISKKKFEEQTARLQAKSEQEIENLKAKSEQAESQLAQVATSLDAKTSELEKARTNLAQKEMEKARLKSKLEETQASVDAKMAAAREQFEAERQKDRDAFDAQMKGMQLSAAEKEAKETEYRAQAAAKEAELGRRLSEMQGKIKDTESQLAGARAQANARKVLANSIAKAFAKSGVKSGVDANTGDVVIDFGDNYFDTGRSDLKPEMTGVLENTLPAYARGLFADPKVASKISSVEMIGYASPTYKGRYVDPESLDPDDRKAVSYNLDLSYQRAKSIFSYVFDTNKMSFEHQRTLLPLVKVTGRSFLEEAKKQRGIAAGTSIKDFCKQYDCKKAQRVIIKINLKD